MLENLLEGLLVPIIGIILFGTYAVYSVVRNGSVIVIAMTGFFATFWVLVLRRNIRNRKSSEE